MRNKKIQLLTVIWSVLGGADGIHKATECSNGSVDLEDTGSHRLWGVLGRHGWWRWGGPTPTTTWNVLKAHVSLSYGVLLLSRNKIFFLIIDSWAPEPEIRRYPNPNPPEIENAMRNTAMKFMFLFCVFRWNPSSVSVACLHVYCNVLPPFSNSPIIILIFVLLLRILKNIFDILRS